MADHHLSESSRHSPREIHVDCHNLSRRNGIGSFVGILPSETTAYTPVNDESSSSSLSYTESLVPSRGLRRKKAVPNLRLSTRPVPYGTPARPYYAALRKHAFTSPASPDPHYIDDIGVQFSLPLQFQSVSSVKRRVRLPGCITRRNASLADERRLQEELSDLRDSIPKQPYPFSHLSLCNLEVEGKGYEEDSVFEAHQRRRLSVASFPQTARSRFRFI